MIQRTEHKQQHTRQQWLQLHPVHIKILKHAVCRVFEWISFRNENFLQCAWIIESSTDKKKNWNDEKREKESTILTWQHHNILMPLPFFVSSFFYLAVSDNSIQSTVSWITCISTFFALHFRRSEVKIIDWWFSNCFYVFYLTGFFHQLHSISAFSKTCTCFFCLFHRPPILMLAKMQISWDEKNCSLVLSFHCSSCHASKAILSIYLFSIIKVMNNMKEKERKLDEDNETGERMKREAFNQCAMPRHTITTTTNNMRIRPIFLIFFSFCSSYMVQCTDQDLRN